MSIWRKFGEYLNIGIFLTVLFWHFELVDYSQNPSDKETFFSVFCHVSYTSKYLRVMELHDISSSRWSNLWLVLAKHGVEPALTALFQRSAQ